MKKAMVFLLCLCMSVVIFTADAGAYAEDNGVALFIDDEAFAPPAPMIVINGTTFVPLRSFCMKMDENAVVTWDGITKTASVISADLAIEVTLGEEYMTANGRYLYIPDGSFMHNNYIMVPVRNLAKAYGAAVTWDGATNTATVTSGGSVILNGDIYYDQDDLFWLSRIIFSESGAEVLDGQIGVGNVVMNRISCENYPDTIYDVIFDTQFGIQFSPIANGAIYKTPSDQSVIAAKLVLDGARTVGSSLFFLNESIATSRWICSNKDLIVTIGGHSFYA